MSTVLIVDDDDDIRDLMAFILRRHGYAVTSTGDPLEALAAAASSGFDVALVDWSMPVMGGAELCERLRELPSTREMPILVVTAHADPQTREQAVAAGATRFVTKPFSLDQLAAAVGEVLVGSSS